MRTGRTKRSISLDETFGMREQKHRPTWVVTLDRGRAVVLEKTPWMKKPTIIEEIENPAGRVRGKELVSDRPGRSFDSHTSSHHGQTAGPRHGYSNRVAPHEQAMHRLNEKVASILDQGRRENRYSELVVIAEPHMLGDLHQTLGTELSKRITRELHEDWAHLHGDGLVRRVADALRE